MSLIRSKRSNKFEQSTSRFPSSPLTGASLQGALHSRKCGTCALSPIRSGKSFRFLLVEVEAF